MAGGCGGASGTRYFTDHGGFGGGSSGGSCHYENYLNNLGEGTQTGSSSGYRRSIWK